MKIIIQNKKTGGKMVKVLLKKDVLLMTDEVLTEEFDKIRRLTDYAKENKESKHSKFIKEITLAARPHKKDVIQVLPFKFIVERILFHPITEENEGIIEVFYLAQLEELRKIEDLNYSFVFYLAQLEELPKGNLKYYLESYIDKHEREGWKVELSEEWKEILAGNNI